MPPAPIVGSNRGGNARGALVDFSKRAPRGGALSGIADIAQSVGQIVENNNRGRDAIQSVKAEGAYKRTIAEKLDGLDPLAPDYEQRAREIVDTELQSTMDGAEMSTDAGRQDLSVRLQRLAEGTYNNALTFRRTELEKAAVETWEDASNEALAAIRQDPDFANVYTDVFRAQAKRLNENISPERLDQMAEGFGDLAVEAQVEGLAEAGRFDDARKVAAENEKSMAPDKARTIKARIREIETRKRNEAKAATAEEVADLSISIIDAENVGQLSAVRDRIERRNEEGLFEGREGTRASLIGALESKRAALRKAGEDTAVAWTKYQAGGGVDTQKEADAAYALFRAREGENADPATVLDRAAEFTRQAAMVPSAWKNVVKRAERSDNPEQLAVAAQFYDSVRRRDPDERIDVGADPQASRVRMVSTYAEHYGVSHRDAAAFVVASTPDAATRKERSTAFGEQFPDFDARESMKDMGAAQGGGLFGWFTDDDVVSAEAAKAYGEMVKMNYILTGDKSLAEEEAARQVQRTYGQSRLSGTPEVVKYPVENFLPPVVNRELPVEKRAELVRADINRGIEGLPVTPPDPLPTDFAGDEDLFPPFRLQATGRFTDNGKPIYRIGVRRMIGGIPAYPPIKNARDGNRDLPYVPPTIEELQALPEYKALLPTGKRQPGSRGAVEQTLDELERSARERDEEVDVRSGRGVTIPLDRE